MLWGCRACGAAWARDSPVCPSCLGGAERVSCPRRGTVVEHSEAGGEQFCAADFGGVRLMCPIASGAPSRGATAELTGEGTEVRILPDRGAPGR